MALFKLKRIFRINYPGFTRVFIRHVEATCPDPEASQKFSLENKVAVVTGGASGIGFSIAKEFLEQGVSVVNIIDSDKNKLEESANTLKSLFGQDKVISSRADVGDTEDMDSAFRNSEVQFQSIDIIVNNAGMLDDTNWELQLNSNIRGTIIGTLLGMQYLAKSSSGEGGTIINVGSTMSMTPSCGFPIHTMTQFGIAGFTRSLGSSKLFQRTGVKVFGYCPGFTDTDALKNITEKAINNNFADEFQEEIKDIQLQDPGTVAKGLVEIMGEAKPGSIWVVDNNKSPYELEFPKIVEKKEEEKEQAEQLEKQEQQQLPK